MKKTLTILLVQLFMVTAVFGQETEKPRTKWAVGGYVGPSVLFGDFDTPGLGVDFGLTGQKVITNVLSLRIDVGMLYNGSITDENVAADGRARYLSSSYDGSLSRAGNTYADYKTTSFYGDALAVLNVPLYTMFGAEKSKLNTYFMGGLGLITYSARATFENHNNQLFNLVKAPELELGELWHGRVTYELVFGAGGSYMINDKWDAFLEGRFAFIPDDKVDGLNKTGTGGLSMGNDVLGSLRFGMRYRFNKKDENAVDWYDNHEAVLYNQTAENTKRIDAVYADDDQDGIPNYIDKDPNTPKGVYVDGAGRPLDIDQDGVADFEDDDVFTPKGTTVNAKGLAVDSDADGVPDAMDKEPNTPKGNLVNFQGISIASGLDNIGSGVPSVFFDFNSSKLKSQYVGSLAIVLSALNDNKDAKVLIIGHTDRVGSEKYNQSLGLKRAESVKEALVAAGVDASRIMTDSKGKEARLASTTKKSSAMINRRAEIKIIK